MRDHLAQREMNVRVQIPVARRIRVGILVLVGGIVLFAGFDGMTKNWADLEVGASDPSLEAVVWPRTTSSEAVDRAATIVRALPRWKVISLDSASGSLHATHTTLVWRFVDDVKLKFAPTEGGTRITAHSRSRVGKGDLGQNARNLRELASALRQAR